MRPVFSGYRVGKPTGGEQCEALERDLETHYSVPHARVLNSGTSALHAALVAVGVGPGDEVMVPAYSMSASASAILHAGATPVFCDIGDDYCLDWDDARARTTPRTRAVVLVHLFGHHATVPADIACAVVHDASQSPSLAPRVRDGRADLWVYSLNQWKIVTCGEGGYILAFDQALADRIHLVRNHGECVSDDVLGYNYRMTEMEAKVARAEFADLDRRLDERRTWAYFKYHEHDLPEDRGNIDWFIYPVRVYPDKREEYAARVGGNVGYHKPIYQLPYFQKRYPHVSLPNVECIEGELVVINPLDTAA